MDFEIESDGTLRSATVLSWLGTNDDKLRAKLVALDYAELQPIANELIDPLVDVLATEQDEWTRCDAAMILGRMGDNRAIDVLRKTVREDASPWVRNVAANALGDLRSSDAIDDLVALLHHPDQDAVMRSKIVFALGNIGDPVVLPHLMDIINNQEDAALCANAVDMIRHVLKADEATTIYVMLLNHEIDYIRAEAARALGYVATRPIAKTLRDIIVTNLIKALSDRGRSYHYFGYVCNEAARSLSQINTPEAIAALEQWKELK